MSLLFLFVVASWCCLLLFSVNVVIGCYCHCSYSFLVCCCLLLLLWLLLITMSITTTIVVIVVMAIVVMVVVMAIVVCRSLFRVDYNDHYNNNGRYCCCLQ